MHQQLNSTLKNSNLESYSSISNYSSKKIIVGQESSKHVSSIIQPIPTQDDNDLDALRDSDSDGKVGLVTAIGIYLIISGKCTVIHPYDHFLVKTLFRDDMFGENEILKINGYHAFGDIVAEDVVK